MKNEMKLEQFIGIFPNAISDDLCSDFLSWFNLISEQGLTMSASQETGAPGTQRKDEVIGIPLGLPTTCFPDGYCMPLWKSISECLVIYSNEWDMNEYVTSHDFKMHRVKPGGGYHLWHHEHSIIDFHRILAWHLTIEAPESGGETEFLYQSMRLEPKVGQLTIWPAAFTHKHRGNPPLEGQKTYLTGWFDLTPPPKQ